MLDLRVAILSNRFVVHWVLKQVQDDWFLD